MVNGLLLVAIADMAACSAVSFTHASGAKGQSITNAEQYGGDDLPETSHGKSELGG